ncbi:MAG: hypothetical protein KGR48_13245 [Alphaproteobacteria bacterium]|nr:hypothetical protein [Alphaproteobacteria bacterium]MBU6473738.1 hypothetical protein [Alphaproteobacteria bacterium]MDE2011698.1 hypothetical protein [Alphaproteobacteria bacterium]MDE2075002.1 hypothetical protein [Alphaproteobacteria bacterium]MDE2352738.1 hypothetical protein [Alphaproteobacteria bacterium]
MMRLSVRAAAVGAALCILPQLAWAQATATTTTTTNTPAHDPNRIVCKSGPPPTGTRLPGARVCKTQQQWDQERQDAQDELNRIQVQRGLGNSGQ